MCSASMFPNDGDDDDDDDDHFPPNDFSDLDDEID